MTALPDSDATKGGLIVLSLFPHQEDVKRENEDWIGVTSTAKRRQLQNKLNQRAHRRRKRQLEGDSAVASNDAATAPSSNYRDQSVQTEELVPMPNVVSRSNAVQHCCQHTGTTLAAFAQTAHTSYIEGAPKLSHLALLIQWNTSSAFLRNAELLGLVPDYHAYHGISRFNKQGPNLVGAAGDWPPNLVPTMLQRAVEHHPWIDAFPLPRLRDNILEAIQDPSGVCDEDDLCHDLVHYDCHTSGSGGKPLLIVWGDPSDARSWEASSSFVSKWGFLLVGCPEIVMSTNYWREKRGLKRILIEE